MSRSSLGALAFFVIVLLSLSGWLIWRGIDLSQNSYLTGAPPEDLKNSLAPKNIDLATMHPPAVRATDPMRYGGATSVASIIEYGDFECENCRAMSQVLQDTLPRYGGTVRLVWRDLPVSDKNPHAMDAAIFSRCATIQGKFWEVHDALMQAVNLNETTFSAIALNAKLDQGLLAACRRDPSIQRLIEEDVNVSRHDGVDSAPFLFIGTKAHRGIIDQATLEKEIETFLQS